MGAGGSKDLELGVPANPRVNYADELSKKQKKPKLIDAPVLMHLEHGTIRYRYAEKEDDPKDKKKRIEKPHEGTEMKKKIGYFYQPKVNKPGIRNVDIENEQWRFRYVCQGPASSKQKKVFYVFGNKLEDVDKGIIKEKPLPHRATHFWSITKRLPNHVYYSIHFKSQLEVPDESEDREMDIDADLTAEAISRDIKLIMSDQDSVRKLKCRLSVRLLKPLEHIHIYRNDAELVDEDNLANSNDGNCQWKRFMIHLKPL